MLLTRTMVRDKAGSQRCASAQDTEWSAAEFAARELVALGIMLELMLEEAEVVVVVVGREEVVELEVDEMELELVERVVVIAVSEVSTEEKAKVRSEPRVAAASVLRPVELVVEVADEFDKEVGELLEDEVDEDCARAYEKSATRQRSREEWKTRTMVEVTRCARV